MVQGLGHIWFKREGAEAREWVPEKLVIYVEPATSVMYHGEGDYQPVQLFQA